LLILAFEDHCIHICDWIWENPPFMYKNLNPFHSHTQALSRHSNKIAIDKKVCLYRQLFANPVKSQSIKTDPVGPLRGINRVAWGSMLFHRMSFRLIVWLGATVALCLACWTHSWSAVSTGSVNPHPLSFPPTHLLICDTHDIAGCVKCLSKPASSTSSYTYMLV